jgi:hypothetical protein
LDEEKSKFAGLAQKNSSIGHFQVVGKRRITFGKECHKYDRTAAQDFSLAYHDDWSRLFAISSTPPIRCPSFAKKVNN